MEMFQKHHAEAAQAAETANPAGRGDEDERSS
jgi:hypothetical protein